MLLAQARPLCWGMAQVCASAACVRVGHGALSAGVRSKGRSKRSLRLWTAGQCARMGWAKG